MTRFNPDLPKANGASRSLVTQKNAGLMRALMRAGHHAAGLFQRQHKLASGQEVWLFGPKPDPATPRPAFLWIHGGGLILGSPASERKMAKHFAAATGAIVACPTYRLAPKHPYPAALHDVYGALEWLAALPGVDETRVAIGGDSAGGHLAAATTILARDRGGPALAFQLLHEPMLDCRAAQAQQDADSELFRIWGPKVNAWAWTQYLSSIAGDIPPTASPAVLEDATGLPPTFLGVGTSDLFHGETVAYADTLRRAGVDVTLETVRGGYHGFLSLEAESPVSRSYLDAMTLALRNAITKS